MREELILRQYAEESAILWGLRSRIARKSGASFKRLLDFDLRLEAHLDGLRTAGEAGWDAVSEVFEEGGRGTLFASAATALAQTMDESFLALVCKHTSEADCIEIASALAWVSPRWFTDVAAEWISAGETMRVTLVTCSLLRYDPGSCLADAIFSHDAFVAARALRAAGELGRRDLLSIIEQALHSDEALTRRWAMWAGARLGGASAREALLRAASDSVIDELAICTVARAADESAVRAYLRSEPPGHMDRTAVILAGHFGDPSFVPLLLAHMSDRETARQSGEAFANLTGIDLDREHMVRKPPEIHDPNESTEDDQDANLPWPDEQQVSAWWKAHAQEFQPGVRYVAGIRADSPAVPELLRSWRQGFRWIAAAELSVREPRAAMFNVCAPAFRQIAGISAIP